MSKNGRFAIALQRRRKRFQSFRRAEGRRRARLRIAKSSISERRFSVQSEHVLRKEKQVFRVKSSRSRMVSRMRLVLAHTRQTSPSLGFDFADIYRFVLEVRRSAAFFVSQGHILAQIRSLGGWFPEQHGCQ